MNSILNKEITTFEEVRKYLSNIPNIHFGGCGISALSMYRWLKKNGREAPKIILLYNGKNYQAYENNKKTIRKEGMSSLIASDHCAIQYKSKTLDVKQEIFIDYSFQQKIEEQEMLTLLNNGICWNPEFSKQYVPRIGERLKIDLSDVCLNN
ncbi:hypothetical protein M0R72_04160 [Candidatus Pacearchaeota archaeon]|jgi:hypothetical protein|nr:hypothetical protein [Candidatus Pacearchaeota archaeon]